MRCISHTNRRFFGSAAMLAVLMILSTSLIFAEKTDVVILKRGDKITGEIRKLDRGRLEYATDDIKTIYINWEKIARISSKQIFDIELATGVRYVGSLTEASVDEKVAIIREEGKVTLDLISIVRIVPLEARFFQRFKGYLDFGFSYQKANNLTTMTSGAEFTYHTPKWETSLDFSTYFTKQDTVESTTRNTLGLSFTKFLPKLWSVMVFGRAQQNEELGLDLRAFVGGGAGRHLIKNNRMTLLGAGGLTINSEKYTDTDTDQYSAEALLALDFQKFRYHGKDLDISVTVKIFPSITDFGRVRIEFDSRVYYEIFNDFFLTLGAFDHFDSRPPAEGDVAKNDFGIDTTITWKFQ